MTDKNKIFAAIVICMATAAVSLVGGMIAEGRRGSTPAVEIIEVTKTSAEYQAITTTVSVSATIQTSQTVNEPLMININTASAEDLDKLKGIGEATAQAIIEYREQTPFEKIEDIMDVKGIGSKKFEDIKDYICV